MTTLWEVPKMGEIVDKIVYQGSFVSSNNNKKKISDY